MTFIAKVVIFIASNNVSNHCAIELPGRDSVTASEGEVDSVAPLSSCWFGSKN